MAEVVTGDCVFREQMDGRASLPGRVSLRLRVRNLRGPGACSVDNALMVACNRSQNDDAVFASK